MTPFVAWVAPQAAKPADGAKIRVEPASGFSR
jgi:hypothetical protein